MTEMGKVDRTALRFNQFCIVFFTALAFIFNLKWLIAATAAVMLAGTIFPKAGLFKLFYKNIIAKTGILKPVISNEDNKPHLFAQGLGGVFLTLGYAFLTFFNAVLLGWILSLIVLTLALVNLTFNFCMGCFLYYQIHKFDLSGLNPGVKE